MTTLKSLWHLARYKPMYFTCKSLVRITMYMERIVFGLVCQAFLNALPAQHQLTPAFFILFLPWLLAIAVRVGVYYAGMHGIVHFDFRAQALLQHNLFQHLLNKIHGTGKAYSQGESISYLRDDPQYIVNMLTAISSCIALLLYSLAAFVILLRTNVWITLLVFLPLVVILALTRQAQKSLQRYRQLSRETTTEVTGAIGEIFSSVQAIQVAGAEPYVVAHFQVLSAKRRQAMLLDQLFSTMLQTVTGNVSDIGTGLTLVLIALLVNNGALGPGGIFIFTYYLALVTGFFNEISNLLASYTQTKVSFTRLESLLPEARQDALVAHQPLPLQGALPEIAPIKAQATPLECLVMRNLSYRYPGGERGIEKINLSLQRGTLTVITGRIGAGKTTLVRTLLGLLPRTEGELYWNGKLITDPASFFLPPQSAYTPQVPHLFSDSLRENILLGWPEQSDRQTLDKAITTAVLEPDIAGLEQGLETLVGTRGVKLSGGQIQRTAAARMLVREAELLVFDDLSSALDITTERRLWQSLFSGGERTCLVVSHRPALLELADQVIILKAGRIEAAGPFTTLLETSEELQAILHRQV